MGTLVCNNSVNVPTAINVTVSHVNACVGSSTTGSITLNFSGGSGPYTIEFNGSGGFVAQTSPKTYSGLAAGTYTWIVKDANGCTSSGSEEICQPAAIMVTDSHMDVSCNGGSTGSITLNFSGGTGPYTIEFNGTGGFVSQTSPKTYSGLTAGTYTWIVKDAIGCTTSGSETISTSSSPVVSCSANPSLIILSSANHSTQLDVNLSGS